ncbi:MAG: hypothetical protein ACPKQO_06295 [Nitrososphaeraceae archaeon]
MKKNNLILLILISTLSIVIGTSTVYAQENMTGGNVHKFFAIQHAQSGTISEINVNFTLSIDVKSNNTILTGDKSNSYQLVLNNVSDKTVLFSDRPNRIVASVSTADLIGNWSTAEDSFGVDAPNAVLVVDEQEEKQDIAIVELFNPVYEVYKKTLKYDIIPENKTSIGLPSQFGKTTLVIDPTRGDGTTGS